jgi:hypothetical protein
MKPSPVLEQESRIDRGLVETIFREYHPKPIPEISMKLDEQSQQFTVEN